MNRDYQAQLARLREKALGELRPLREVSGVRALFTIIELPSFAPSVSWTVCAGTKAKSEFSVRKKVWRSDADSRAFESPIDRLRYPTNLQPTIEESIYPVSGATVLRYEAELTALRVSPFVRPPTSVYCDGTSYEFWSDVVFSSCRMTWHEDGPEEWRTSLPVLRRILDDLKTTERKQPAEG